jgi:catechol 2,3-dioxygenase-like lactoylglutathione lyase family enzyme
MALQPDMVGIVVRDMDRALGFYRLLGLAVPEGAGGEPYVETVTPNGYRISWNALAMVRELDPDWVEPAGHRMELAFKCGSPAEVDEVFATVTAAGHAAHRAPWDAFWGQRYAIVVDPDGNRVSLFAPLAAK